MHKRLIINADDFGYCPEQNAAIKTLLSEDLISSTSVLAVGPAFEDAAQWLRASGRAAGVHLALNSDSAAAPWRSMTGSPRLGSAGTLFSDARALTLHATHAAVRAELEAQYEALRRAGVTVDHADNHSGTLYGINLRRFYLDANDFCRAHALPYRFPKTPGFLARQLGRTPPRALLRLQQRLVRRAEACGVRLIDDLISNPWSMERIGDYETLRAWYLDALDHCADGVTELFLHPALPVGDAPSEWTKRVFEYQMLKSGDLQQKAKENGMTVVTWRDV